MISRAEVYAASSYSGRLAAREQARCLGKSLQFGLAVGWTLTLTGAFHYYILLKDKYWLWICLAGVGMLVVSLLLPGILYYPRMLLKSAIHKCMGILAFWLSLIVYATAIVPMGRLMQLCRARSSFYEWEKSFVGKAEGWVDKPLVKTAAFQKINYHLYTALLPSDVLGYFIRNEEAVLLPALLLILVLSLTGAFIQYASITPLIYTLF